MTPNPMRPSGAGLAVVSRMISAITAAWRTDVGVPGWGAGNCADSSAARRFVRRSDTNIASV